MEAARQIACEVAEVLDYTHAEGVVHRDVKPENILVSRGHALVADFGVAQVLGSGAAAPGDELGGAGLAVGTASSMAPEQAHGGEVDGRSDIYSLGCVLFEMLAGAPLGGGPTPQAAIAKRLSGPVPSIRRVRPEVSGALDQAIAKAVELAPADRFATAGEFAAALSVGRWAQSLAESAQGARRCA